MYSGASGFMFSLLATISAVNIPSREDSRCREFSCADSDQSKSVVLVRLSSEGEFSRKLSLSSVDSTGLDCDLISIAVSSWSL